MVKKTFLRLPPQYTQTLAHHVNEMFEKGYFLEIGPKDFFHGHFIPHQWSNETQTLFDILNDTPTLLYHTAEYNNRWEKEANLNIPHNLRIPRSIVGLKSGEVLPAIEYLNFDLQNLGRQKSYENSGTVYDTDLVRINPKSSFADLSLLDPHQLKSIIINFKQGPFKVYVQNQFYILPDENGPYSLSNNFRYDFFITVTNQTNPISYSDSIKNGPVIKTDISDYLWPQ